LRKRMDLVNRAVVRLEEDQLRSARAAHRRPEAAAPDQVIPPADAAAVLRVDVERRPALPGLAGDIPLFTIELAQLLK
jgi:hypothetical protein